MATNQITMPQFSTGSGTSALSQLVGMPAGRGIDFMAYAKGRELANELNWRDEVRGADRQNLYSAMTAADQNREAQAYMATLMHNKQMAVAAGVSPTDFLIQQREQIMADPAFQRMSPEVQSKILTNLGSVAALSMETASNANDFNAASQLAQAFGLIPKQNQAMLQAASTGNTQAILDDLNRRAGTNFQMDSNGMLDINGVKVPADAFAYRVVQAGGLGVGGLGYAVEERQRQEAAALAARQQQEQQAQIQRIMALYGVTDPNQYGPPVVGAGTPPQAVAAPGINTTVANPLSKFFVTQTQPGVPQPQALPGVPQPQALPGVPQAAPAAAQSVGASPFPFNPPLGENWLTPGPTVAPQTYGQPMEYNDFGF